MRYVVSFLALMCELVVLILFLFCSVWKSWRGKRCVRAGSERDSFQHIFVAVVCHCISSSASLIVYTRTETSLCTLENIEHRLDRCKFQFPSPLPCFRRNKYIFRFADIYV